MPILALAAHPLPGIHVMGFRRPVLGRLFVRPGELLYVGVLAPTELHRHRAIQCSVALDGAPTLVDAESVEREAPVALVGSEIPHRIKSSAMMAAIAYVDPEGSAGRKLSGIAKPEGSVADWIERAQDLEALRASRAPETWTEAVTFLDRVLATLAGPREDAAPKHPAVLAALEILPELLHSNLWLAAIGARANLPGNRVADLFHQELGVPLRSYVTWLRVIRALEHLTEGCALDEAAERSGLRDRGTLRDVFLRWFGLELEDVLRTCAWSTPPRI